MLALADGAPKFDGSLSLTRPVGIASRGTEQLTQPWHVSGKIKAGAASALMQEFEFQYGSEEQGFQAHRRSRLQIRPVSALRWCDVGPADRPRPRTRRRRRRPAEMPAATIRKSRNWPVPPSAPPFRSGSASASTRSRSAATASRMCAATSAPTQPDGPWTASSFVRPA